MKINKFKIGDKVQVTKNGANASQFNINMFHPIGVYSFPNWKNEVFLIEGTIKLTDFSDITLASSAHLITDLKGNPVGYVYSYALEKAKPEWSYSLTTNTIWFSKDYGRVRASSHTEAKELAERQLASDVEEMNKRLNGFASISINLDELSIEEIQPPK